MKNSHDIHIQNVYDGPMEMLLDLIKKDKIDIYDIPISKVTDQYIERMGSLNFNNVDSFLDFSLLAANLLQIKSKMLLPIQEDEEDEIDPRDELVNRIIEYNYYKQISTILSEYYKIGNKKIIKKPEDLTILSMEENIDFKDMNINSLSRVLSKILRKNFTESIEIEFEIEQQSITMEESISLLENRLENKENLYFSTLFNKNTSKLEIVTFFLSVLELIKSRKINVEQTRNYEDILIKRL